MEMDALASTTDGIYPVLFLPKSCTNLQIVGEMADNIFIDVNILSADIEGNITCIYSGFCNIKLIDTCDVNGNLDKSDQGLSGASSDGNQEMIPDDEFERSDQSELSNQNILNVENINDDEVKCGVLLSKPPEEICHENKGRDIKQTKNVGLESENDALKQLMSSNIQSSKQHNIILFLGHDSHSGQTIQKIAINDPHLVCAGIEQKLEKKKVVGETSLQLPDQKKYQCEKCKQIFDQIADFKQHMVPVIAGTSGVKFMPK